MTGSGVFAVEYQTSIRALKGVGEKRAQLYEKLGADTVGALLQLYPRQYEDWSQVTRIDAAPFDKNCCIKARPVGEVREHRIRKGMTLYKVTVSDGHSRMRITIFNNKYAAAKLKPGHDFLFFGKAGGNFNGREMTSPMIEEAGTGERIRPIYPQTAGLPSRAIESAVAQALNEMKENLEDPLPEALRQRYSLCHRRFALENIHFPVSREACEIAKKRLVFEELLILQLGMLTLKGRSRELAGCRLTRDTTAAFFSTLPFTPTGAQRRAVAECVADMQKPTPMNRLLQGDVGSGKTAVAAALCHTAAASGMQTAFMAPTEILAGQHYKSLSQMFKTAGIRVALLTGSTKAKEKREIYEALEAGEIDVAVGTHALLTEAVTFRRLGFVITDEQHRFGVAQRAALSQKGDHPHLLVMSATPIPRSLGLIIYGDLDISVLDEMPPGRTPVKTYAVNTSYRERAYHYVKKHLDAGRQGYIVCPLVEEGETDLTSAREYAQKLQNGSFRRYQVGLLHGKLNAREKEETMTRFYNGGIQLLVSTTVVEVGVDVPNAVIMVIENAERFGLSQLHQLRGRVGRGKFQSTCILISDAQNPEAVKRLKVMCETNDGFKIADEDLRLRGPGDFFGHRQHGLPKMKIANIFKDIAVLKEARQAAEGVMKADPKLQAPENRLLGEAVRSLFSDIAL